MIGVGIGIKVEYIKESEIKTGTIDAFKYIDDYAELMLDNGDVIMEQEVINEITPNND